MENAFFDCHDLLEIKFPKSYTNSLIVMKNMFSGCNSLEKLNLDFLRTEKVTDMSYLI